MKRIGLVAAGLLSGFVVTAVLSMITTAILRNLWPALGNADQGQALETLDFAYALLYMGVGGYVARWIGGVAAAVALGAVFVVLGVVTAVLDLDSVHSALYQWLLAVSAGGAVWVGSRIAGRGRPTLAA
ncbi:MAG: hypothetical protein Q8Q14_01225 [Gemmatimonadales bacterium]|nr:hypothetical protein [Gemmatimonadales bacterium]